MKKILQNSDIIGGIFGAVAIIAVVFEMAFNGFDTASIAGGIKDIAGTIVTVVLMLTAIKALTPKKEKTTFEERFDNEIKNFVSENSKMLFQKVAGDGNPNFYEIYMQTDFSAYFGKKTKLQPGWFMRMPILNEKAYSEGNIKVMFHLNQGTFFGHQKPEDETVAYAFFGEKIEGLISRENDEQVLDCKYDKSKHIVEITIKKPITSNEDITWFIDILRKVYNSYLVLGDAGINDEMIK